MLQHFPLYCNPLPKTRVLKDIQYTAKLLNKTSKSFSIIVYLNKAIKMQVTNNFNLQKRNRLPEENLPNKKQKPNEWKLPEIQNKTWHYNNKVYKLKKLGSGVNHYVYKFTDDNETITINNKEHDVKNIVLRTFNPDLTSSRFNRRAKEDIKAYQRFKKMNIPMPTCFKIPNTQLKGEYFWLNKKLSPITTNETGSYSNSVLDFVKDILQKSINKNVTLIPDFYPRNVMKDENDSLYFVDTDMPDDDTEDVIGTAAEFAAHWANGCQEALNYIMSEVDSSIQKTFQDTFARKTEAKVPKTIQPISKFPTFNLDNLLDDPYLY